MKKFIKNFDNLTLDFNNFFEMMSENDYTSLMKGKYIVDEQIFKSTFCVENVHAHKFFRDLMQKLVDTYQLTNVKLEKYIG